MKRTSTVVLALLLIVFLITAALRSAEKGRGSDIVRLWIVCQYVNAGQNPWELAKDVLVAKYGEGNPKRVRVSAIPQEVPPHRVHEILPDIGPPEATYPPPAVGLLAPTIGRLPTPAAVLWVWFVVNTVALGWVAVALTRMWPVLPGGGTIAENRQLVLIALLIFPATLHTFRCGQLSLLVLGLLLLANNTSRGSWVRGLALGLALLKPSLALPFFFLPIVNRQWHVLLTAVAVQAMAAGYVAMQLGSVPIVDMFRDWMTISGYFLNGQYTLQEWVNEIAPMFPWLDPTAVSLGMLALCGVTLFAARQLQLTRQFTIAAVTSIFWTYHLIYDFVVLLPVLMSYAGWSNQPPGKRWSAVGLVMFASLAMALFPPVYFNFSDNGIFWFLQWMARMIVAGLFGWEYLRTYLSLFKDGGMRHARTATPPEQPAPSISAS